MDLEVTKAFRTLERVGMSGPTPTMDLEEFNIQYGNLLVAWLKEHGCIVKVIRFGEMPRSLTKQASLLKALTSNFNKDAKVPCKVNFVIRSLPSKLITCASDKNSGETDHIIINYLNQFSLSNLISDEASNHTKPPADQKLVLFLNEDYLANNNRYCFHSYLCTLEQETAEETAQRLKQNASEVAKKDAQKRKRQEATERSRALKERRERETLRKLSQKYGGVNSDLPEA